jgi:hypothetical protein
MCTVSYLPKGQYDYILTSNRDENVNRAKALAPKIEKLGDTEVLFPKDSSKNGTWVGVTHNNRTLCLLNGAFDKHTPTGNYVKSRGLIVLDFFKNTPTQDLVNTYNLDNIEPFTLLIIDVIENTRLLTQLKWDGNIRYIKKLDSNSSHIWSSSTLYNIEETLYKKAIFKQIESSELNPLNADSVFKFHEFSTKKDPNLMKYTNKSSPIETISTTQIETFSNYATLKYKSFKENKESISKINFK